MNAAVTKAVTRSFFFLISPSGQWSNYTVSMCLTCKLHTRTLPEFESMTLALLQTTVLSVHRFHKESAKMFSRSIQVAMERSEQETKHSSQTQPLNMPNTYQYQTHTQIKQCLISHTSVHLPYVLNGNGSLWNLKSYQITDKLFLVFHFCSILTTVLTWMW